MSTDVHIDFESASEVDLTKVGAYAYWEHPSTFVRCMAWKIPGGAAGIWHPGERMSDQLISALKGRVHAWNAQFERLGFQRLERDGLTIPVPTWSQWRCTAAQARNSALPGKLEDCAKVLGTQHQKMDTRIMKRLADANYAPTVNELLELQRYCAVDVQTEMEISSMLPALSDDEQYIYELNERINDRGVLIDSEFCEAMLDYLNQAVGALDGRLSRLTKGEVTKVTQVARLASFLGEKSLAKEFHEQLLEKYPEGTVKGDALRCRIDAARSSTAKYNVMLRQRSGDGRLRGMFMYAGAGQTGRFSSVGAQLHNLPRAVPKDADERVEDAKNMPMQAYQLMYPEPVIHQASQLIRPALIAPPGKTFVIGDYSAVEARGLPWLAGYRPEVDAWAAGVDRYVEDAIAIGLGPEHRQAGKVVRLACGFSGKGGALLAMAKGYGMRLTEAEATRQAHAWHAANPWVEEFAKDLKKQAVLACQNVGVPFSNAANKVTYGAEIRNDKLWLYCRLPSGRILSYFDVKVDYDPHFDSYELSAIKPRGGYRDRLWHGLLAENVTQAACNDLLRHAIVTLHSEGYQIVAHVHDETVEEVDENNAADESLKIKALMENKPEWAADLPLVATVAVSKRYTK